MGKVSCPLAMNLNPDIQAVHEFAEWEIPKSSFLKIRNESR